MTKTRLSALAALALLAMAPAAVAQTPTLKISVYGIAQDEYRRDLYAPFEKKCGCTVVVETANSSERIAKLEANKSAPVIDVAALADFDALKAAREGLLEPIDVSKITSYDKLYAFTKDPIGDHMAVGYTFYATSIVYRSDKIAIDGWADLFKPELAGRIALPNITTTQAAPTLAMLEKAEGGGGPDFTNAFQTLAKHKDDIVTFYERGSQLPQLFAQDEILAAVSGRFNWANILKLHRPIKWATPKEGQAGGMNVLAIVKGTKQKALALQFIDYWLSAEVQTRLANDLVDSPANTDVKVADHVAEALTYGAETAASLHFLPPADVLAHRDEWLAKWNQMIAQ
jgi:putative spermidine/putrescine transport system substrate-binding protein